MMAGRLAAFFLFVFIMIGILQADSTPVKPAREPARTDSVARSIHQVETPMQIPAGIRLMVFSPHPDDETLAAGGLIQRVLATGGKVRVVFITNGDGYLKGVRLSFKHTKFLKDDFIDYRIMRHHEALMAAQSLGLRPDDAIFLGFPDQGIDQLRAQHWSKQYPYTSPFTNRDHPYMSSVKASVKYDGADLYRELRTTIDEFRPNWIVLPDPRDRHPDHATTGSFVLEALDGLGQRDKRLLQSTEIFSYLVHFPGYPDSGKWLSTLNGKSDSPSEKVLSSIQWMHLQLCAKELFVKKNALASYRSQFLVLGSLLREFVRPTEIFGHLDRSQISVLGCIYGKPRSSVEAVR